MEDPTEQLIRRALGRRPPPRLGATLAHDVLQRVAERHPPAPARERAPARRWLVVPWLAVAAASLAVLMNMGWSSGARAVAWGLALAVVPLGYLAALWPDWTLGILALCGSPLLAEPGAAPRGSAARGPGVTRRRTTP
jgi:hypothetical protein